MLRDFNGKVGVVTGAASGIGRAMARKFASEGMNLVIGDVMKEGLEETAALAKEAGAEILSVIVDVTQPESVDALADRAFDHFGSVHLLCNNAGVLSAGPCWELPAEDYAWIMSVNALGPAYGVRSFVPRMIAQDVPGHIVNTASMAGLTTLPFAGAYHMSKHACLALSECLYHELKQTGTKLGVSVLCPELIDTGIAESERCRPESFAASKADPEGGMGKLVIQALEAGMKEGLAPAVMADRVFESVKADRFYILAEDEWRDFCNVRLDDVREGRNPTFSIPSGTSV